VRRRSHPSYTFSNNKSSVSHQLDVGDIQQHRESAQRLTALHSSSESSSSRRSAETSLQEGDWNPSRGSGDCSDNRDEQLTDGECNLQGQNRCLQSESPVPFRVRGRHQQSGRLPDTFSHEREHRPGRPVVVRRRVRLRRRRASARDQHLRTGLIAGRLLV
jgi:hypothetical protein